MRQFAFMARWQAERAPTPGFTSTTAEKHRGHHRSTIWIEALPGSLASLLACSETDIRTACPHFTVTCTRYGYSRRGVEKGGGRSRDVEQFTSLSKRAPLECRPA